MTKSVHALPLGFADFVRALAEHQVQFVVCDGIACALQGVQRGTQDLDVSVSLNNDNMRRLISAARSLGLRPRFPEPIEAIADERKRREWIEQKKAMVMTLISDATPLQLHVFLNYPIPFEDLAVRANRMTIGDVSFLVSCREDLLQAKQAIDPPRKQDLCDIEDLKELIAHDP
jgi:hypothetical protein